MLHVVDDAERPAGRRRSGWAWVPSSRRDVGLIDLVAALVGEPRGGTPSGVHATLSAVGEAVSDLSSPTGRRELRPLALSFPNTAHSGLTTPARLVDVCTSAALASPVELTQREARRLEAAHRLARSLLREGGGAPRRAGAWWLPPTRLLRLDEPLYRRFVAPLQVAEAVGIVARSCGRNRDRRLRTLLVQCLTEVVAEESTGPGGILHPISGTSGSATRHRQSGPVGLWPLHTVCNLRDSAPRPPLARSRCDGGRKDG